MEELEHKLEYMHTDARKIAEHTSYEMEQQEKSMKRMTVKHAALEKDSKQAPRGDFSGIFS